VIRFANPSRAHRIQIRTYGVLCAILAISFICMYWANRNAYGHGRADLYIVKYALAFSVFAAGLLAAKVWAELIFVVCLLLLAVGDAVSLAVDRAQAPDIRFSLFVEALLLIPVGLSIYWLRRREYVNRGD
jgi:hypothetical protein